MWKIKAYVDVVHEERAGQKFKEIKGYGWFSFSSCFSFFFPNSYDCLWTISANDAGSFNNEMAPIEVKTKKGRKDIPSTSGDAYLIIPGKDEISSSWKFLSEFQKNNKINTSKEWSIKLVCGKCILFYFLETFSEIILFP